MLHLIFWLSFTELVALILLPGLAFFFLNKKKASGSGNREDPDTGASVPITPSTATSSGASRPLTTSTGNCYHVFLSFRGPDTRETFTDHLYHGLLDAGIHVFRDDDKLRYGEKIGPELLAAITNSKISIPVLSVKYCESSWCLNELARIMDSMKKNGQMVLPIFYNVTPADVRHQTGSFGEALQRGVNKKAVDPSILKKWKKALRKVGKLRGYEVNGYEAKLVKSIVQTVLSKLKEKFELVISDDLVGIDDHVRNVMNLMDEESHATLFVGIHGMGGIGKTTLAKVIYNKLSNQFEHCSFIADIRESWKQNGVHHLQNQLIYDVLKKENQVRNEDEGIQFISSMFKHKKVLLLLDDVDNVDQLKSMAGNRGWFSSRSRIIITTRDKRILEETGVDCVYDHKEMDESQSLILFSKHAFRMDFPPKAFEDLTHEVVSITGGLPLCLHVFGSILRRKESTQWREMIKKLKKVSHTKVQERLRISYETLDDWQKQIFLDIACFFIGIDKRIASYMWDACGFFPGVDIEILRSLSLIKVGNDHKLIMHDQLRDLGREIVREEDKLQPWCRSRLWDSKEALKVLEENKGTNKIEAINLIEGGWKDWGKEDKRDGDIYMKEQFKNLKRLRFLQMEGAHLSGDFKNSIKELKWLRWKGCPMNFEVTNVHVKELVILELPRSEINDKWEGWRYFKMAEKLKFLDVSDCVYLENTDFLSAFKNLEVLILNGCRRLKQIDSSIGDMKALCRLELNNCHSLVELPAEICKLKALEQLLLRTTNALSGLPDNIGALENLEVLHISGSLIRELPNSIQKLRKLRELKVLLYESHEGAMPESIGSLENLEFLDISFCGIKELPKGIGRLRKLRELHAVYCENLKGERMESLCDLSSLQHLDFDGCSKLKSLPDLPSSLIYLGVTCQNLELLSLSHLTHLKRLRVSSCGYLQYIQVFQSLQTPSVLEILSIDDCGSIKTLDVSEFVHLRKLTVRLCKNLLEVRGLDKLIYLEELAILKCNSIKRLDLLEPEGLQRSDVSDCSSLVEIGGNATLELLQEPYIKHCTLIDSLDLPKSTRLKRVEVSHCKNLTKIPGLDGLELLEVLCIERTSIEMINLVKSRSLRDLHAISCKKLVEIKGLDRLEFLEKLYIKGCTSIERLDLLKSKSLRELYAISCEKLVEIQGLDRLEFLEKLSIKGCLSIERLDLPKLERLKKLKAAGCKKLAEIQGLDRLEFLEKLSIKGCTSIERLDLPKSGNLKELDATSCEKLIEIQGLDTLKFLELLTISGCKSLKTVPKLLGTRVYSETIEFESETIDSETNSMEVSDD